ncbi:MAG: hypothetical protein U1F68_01965 [Gammaproteobacteria bacterium]
MQKYEAFAAGIAAARRGLYPELAGVEEIECLKRLDEQLADKLVEPNRQHRVGASEMPPEPWLQALPVLIGAGRSLEDNTVRRALN